MAMRGICVRSESIEKVKSALIRNGYTTQRALAEAAEISLSTVRNFLKGKNISRANFLDICEYLELNFEEVADLDTVSPPAITKEAITPVKTTYNSSSSQQDWGEAPDVLEFYGRAEELATLQQWITEDKCRLIALLGMGGIGKTALSVKLAKTITTQHPFQFVIWRSLRESPPVEKIVTDLIKILSCQQETDLPDSLGEKITKLIGYLNSSRCLVVLDNAESILQDGTQAGCYRQGYEGYGTLLRRLGNSSHQSCVLITSREKPTEIAASEGETRLVRTLPVLGLTKSVQKILKAKGISGSAAEMTRLTEVYSGNPLAINIVATSIKDLFGGNLATFLAQETTIFSDIERLLDSQFNRLGQLEEGIMYWLAINREPVSWEGLQDDIFFHYPTISQLTESLQGLRRRSLIERVDDGFTLQNVVMEYMTQKLITGVREEIISPARLTSASLCHRYALMKATAKDYVRKTQRRLIVQPVVEGIRNIEARLQGLLEVLREEFGREASYGAGNVLNLLNFLDVDVSGYDFSGLSIWQAYLQGRVLHGVNFAHADFFKCVFTKTFGGVFSVTFSPDGKFLVAGDVNGEIRLWRVADITLVLTLQGHSNYVWSVAFSPDGNTLASGSADQTIKLWDVNTGKCLYKLQGHSNRLRSVIFSPDGNTLASGSDDKTIKLWDVNNGKCLHTFQGHNDWVRSVVFSPDGNTLASGSEDTTIKLWDVNNGKCLHTFQGHNNWVRSVVFSPDGNTLASGSDDKTIKLWDINNSKCLRTLQGHNDYVRSVVFSPDGNTLASGSEDKTVKLWDVNNGKCLRTLQGHHDCMRSAVFSPDGSMIATGSEDKYFTVKLWDINNGRCLRTLQGHYSYIRSVIFSPDGNTLASGSEDKTVKLWDVNNGKCLHTFQGHNNWVRSVAFSPNSNIIASGSDDETIKLWDVNNGECLHTFQGHSNRIWSVTFSPDNKFLASCGGENIIKLWDIEKGTCLLTLTGHSNWVRSVAFSPDGKTLASGSYDNTIKLWDIEKSTCLLTLTGHSNWVRSVAFSPDGKTLASSGEDETMKIWDTKTGKCLKTFRAPRPYEGTNITGVRGLTQAQKANLKALGAIESD